MDEKMDKKKRIRRIMVSAVLICLAVAIIVYCVPNAGLVKGSTVPNSDSDETIIVDASGRKFVSPYAFFVNTFYRTANKLAGSQDNPFANEDNAATKPDPFEPVTEENYRIDEVVFNGCKGEKVTPTEANRQYVLYIHGGGFSSGSAKERRSITTYLATEYGFTVYANDYRFAPQVGLPDMQEDCLTFYLGILDSGVDAQNIIVMGDSAGAHLSLTLGLILRDRGLPQPKAIGCFSPVVEFAEQYPSRTENVSTDFMLANSINTMNWQEIFSCEAEDLEDPYMSPIRGDFTGVAPVFIAVSDYETPFDDSVKLYEKLKDEGHQTELNIQHGLVHAYVIFGNMKETQVSISHFMNFVNKHD